METEKIRAVHFKATVGKMCQFTSTLRLLDIHNQVVFNAFVDKFNQNPQDALDFIGVKKNV